MKLSARLVSIFSTAINVAIVLVVLPSAAALGLLLGVKAGALTQQAEAIARELLWLAATASLVMAAGQWWLGKIAKAKGPSCDVEKPHRADGALLQYTEKLATLLEETQRDFNHVLLHRERLRFAVHDGFENNNWSNARVALDNINNDLGRCASREWSMADHKRTMASLIKIAEIESKNQGRGYRSIYAGSCPPSSAEI